MNPIYHPSDEQPVPTDRRAPLPFLLIGTAAFSAALLWLKYRAADPALEARTRQRLAPRTSLGR